MAKKAYLYTFHPTTRVVADPSGFKSEDDLYDYITAKAREQMLNNGIEQYLCGDNGEYEEDTECPYGTFSFDN